MPIACIRAYIVVGPTKTNPCFFRAFDRATDSAETLSTWPVGSGAGCCSGRKDRTKSSSPPRSRRSTVARALVIAARTFSRLRTIRASPISRSKSASSYAATTSASKPAKTSRKASRLFRIVSHERPDWKASRVSRSRYAASPCTGTPHSVSW